MSARLVSEIFPPPSIKEGRFNIITLLQFIDKAVVGTFNTIMVNSNQPDRQIDCYPFKSDHIEKITGDNEDDGTSKRILTYRIRKAEPAMLTRGTKDRKYRLRATEQVPNGMNALGTPMVQDIYGKWVDYTIRLDCFAPTWLESQALALEVEDLLETCTDYITSKGIVKFINNGRNSDIYHMKTQYFYESFTFMARIEKIKVEQGETFQELWTMFDDKLMGIIK